MTISEQVRSASCFQISHEKYNSNFYMFISGFLQNKGLDKISEHFLQQIDEEQTHSRMIYDFLIKMDGKIDMQIVPEVVLDISDPISLANAYIQRETDTTKNLNDIRKLAIEESDPLTEEFYRSMLTIQITEMDEANSFKDKSILSGNDWWKLECIF